MKHTADSKPRLPGCIGGSSRARAFTLVEVMVSMVVLAIMMMLIAQIIGTTQRSWRSASSRLAQFREARIAFDTITRNLRQATLNPYRDFHYAGGKGVNKNLPPSDKPTEPPDGFIKISELGFVSGRAADLVSGAGSVSGHAVFFQAPLGLTEDMQFRNLKNLLCARGYFVQFGPDTPYLPSGLRQRLKSKDRFRLMEFQPPAEKNSVYSQQGDNWFQVGESNLKYLRPVSDKIVALVISPRLAAGNQTVSVGGVVQIPTAIAPSYGYDSRVGAVGIKNELPPVVRVSMMALDDASLDTWLKKENSHDLLEKANVDFASAERYEEDISRLKEYMARNNLNYRLFEAYVSIPSSGI
ncbi:MAG: Verru_Chthon cassette protein C [Verrucomicrobiaceae bacterium]|nr:Verru_Chthon cassette protein C [Verrucomicrobiaceae bacterium]